MSQVPGNYVRPPDVATFQGKVGAVLGELVRQGVRDLLQNKHLYQSVQIPGDLLADMFEETPVYKKQIPAALDNWQWFVEDRESLESILGSLVQAKGYEPKVVWKVPDAKLYCARCRREEPFNALHGTNLLSKEGFYSKRYAKEGAAVQVYSLALLCQSCKLIPEVFMVRRQGSKLTLSGRSPMESVQVPSVIPKVVATYYSDAVVAFQSGQTLAALFMLRTLCEQWVRPLRQGDERVDQVLARYLETLPQVFKVKFPSLTAIYSDLSAAIHEARPDAELYESARARIEKHFDARRVFELTDLPS